MRTIKLLATALANLASICVLYTNHWHVLAKIDIDARVRALKELEE